jgi:DNA replication protein DnaC
VKDRALSELRTEYESQRALNRDEERRRLEQASALDPEIGRLTESRRRLFQDNAREAFANPTKARDISGSLADELQSIARNIRGRLIAAGLPEDYLQPVYRCPICRDFGYVGEPIHEMCDCMKRRVYAKLCHDPGLGIAAEENFGAWDAGVFDPAPLPEEPRGQRAYMIRARALCERFANSFPNNEKHNLLFTGASGLGKTYLLNCIAQRVLERGYTPWKLTAYELMGILRDSYFERGDPQRAQLVLDTQLLIIDDLGTEPIQENLTIPQLFHVFNERRNRRLSTIVSTNLAPTEIQARYTERLASRLLDQRTTIFLKFIGKDVRLNLSE